MTPLAVEIEVRLRAAMAGVLPEGVDPAVRRSDRADFQANGLLGAAKKLGVNPRGLAEDVAARMSADGLLASCEVSGPGFLNLRVADSALLAQAAARLGDARLGVPVSEGGTTVIDYSQPNIAKEMHVGHLRSTIIGDALARTLGFLGEHVVRQNHLGDWGTQFGMLIQFLEEGGYQHEQGSVSRLNQLYRESQVRYREDAEFAERARKRVVALQSGEPETVARWEEIVAESKTYFSEVYAKLDVLLTDEDQVGESFYNPSLHDVADELERLGVAQISDGALCVFFDDATAPLIIRKSDGGFGYAATDLAAIRHRVGDLGAHRILYVVDSRQALHFRMVFETARRAGWLDEKVAAVHVPFGTVLGPDGKPFKTRSGKTVRLVELLDEAVEHAYGVVQEKSQLEEEALWPIARLAGVGAVKYADLSTSRTKDYVYDASRMVSLNGNTGVYLQYAHARARSILRKGASDGRIHPGVSLEPAERALILELDEFDAALQDVAATYEPHRLCVYLFDLAQAFTAFFEGCPVLKAPADEMRDTRLALCRLTAETLKTGLGLLGLAAPDRL